MKLSIIIPVYNHAHELEKCIDSILVQSRVSNSPLRQGSGGQAREWFQGGGEIIVVNDGSTDDLDAGIKNLELRIKERGIRFEYVVQENRGAAAARNRGFDASSGQYLFFCDADIRLNQDCLGKMMKALGDHPDAAFSYSQFMFGHKKFKSHLFDLVTLRKLNYIHTSSLIRRSAFPRFDESLKKFQDWDLFLTIAEKGGKGAFIPEVLYTIKTGGTMSEWVPSFAYHAPFKYLPWWKESVQKYENARQIIRLKHGLTLS